MTERAHIVVVDDDPLIRELVESYLASEGYRVSKADSGAAMRDVLAADPADLVILDLSMPGEHGFTLVTELRKQSDVGIIIMTASESEVDQVVGLELGADDYVSKPTDLRQLLARVRSVLRRTKAASGAGAASLGGDVVIFDGWRLMRAARRLFAPDGAEVSLTTIEFDLLTAFIDNANRVLNRDQLLDKTHDREWSPFDRSIDNSVSRLRHKIEADPKKPQLIKTVRGVGYVFTAKVTAG